MKVLLVSNLYQPNIVGGAEKVAQNVAEGLVARGHSVSVATIGPTKTWRTDDVNGVLVHYLPARNFYPPNQAGHIAVMRALWHALDSYNPFMASSLGRVLDAENPEVVNTHNISGFSVSVWNTIKSRRIPLVHTVHDYYLLCPRGSMYRGGRVCPTSCASCRAYCHFGKRVSQFVNMATAPSRFVLDKHLQNGYFSHAESVPIYNCYEVPPERAAPGCDKSQPLRFGFLGQLRPIKGVDRLVRSFLELNAGQAELVIAGRGTPDYERGLKALADGCPGVHWVGFVPPEKLLRQVDVLVVPSLWQDSAPLVVLEALGNGVPVIGARRGGIPELVGEGTGWVFDPDERGSLTQAMIRAIDSRDELCAMSERAVQWARRFSTRAMVDGYLAAYSHALERNTNTN